MSFQVIKVQIQKILGALMFRLIMSYFGYYFFKITSFTVFCPENLSFLMTKSKILHAFIRTTSCGMVDKI